MANYYLDIETTGLDPKKDKIITIQFMKLDMHTALPKDKLIILKEWESSEKGILHNFIEISNITNENEFAFVPVGFNLGFEHNFLLERTRQYGLGQIDILNRPFIDLKSIAVIMNHGEFRGSGLDKISGKKNNGSVVPDWHANKEYDKILSYIENEAEEFVKLATWLYKELPMSLNRFKNSAKGL